MKKNIEWYARRKDSHRHPKFKMLRSLYGGGNMGWAMEGRFWALNDIIADAEGCKLDISQKRNRADIAESIGLSLQELDQFVDNLLSEDVQLLVGDDNGLLTTKKVQEALEIAITEREKSRLRKGKGKISAGNAESSGELPESSGEDLTDKNKEYKRREDKKIKDKTASPESYSSFSNSFISESPKDNFDYKSYVRNSLLELNIGYPDERSLNTFLKFITRNVDIEPSKCYKIFTESCQIFPTFSENQRNLGYLLGVLKRKIETAQIEIVKAREQTAAAEKLVEKKEIEEMAKNNGGGSPLDDLTHIMAIMDSKINSS